MARLSSRQQEFTGNAYAAAYAAGLRGVQADLAVSQAVHESAWGAKPSGTNNVHGIKGKTGTSVKTHEYENGKRVNQKATFRDFPSLVDSFKAWKGLMERRYQAVMKATTFTEALSGLRAGQVGGYATDPKYNDKLQAIGGLVGTTGTTMAPAPANMPTPAPSPRGMNAHAYAGLTRSLAPRSPTTPAQAYGQYARSMQDTGLLGLDSRDGFFSASVEPVERAPLGPPAAPAAFSPPSRPSTPTPAGAYPSAPVDRSAMPQNPGQLGGITMSNPVGLGGPGGLYLGGLPSIPAAPITQPIAPVQALPATPAPAIAPALAASRMSDFPSAPRTPSLAPSDVYGGQVGTAMSSSGNMVGRDNFGFTSVTNKHGATTVTTPGGMQAAQFGGIKGPLGGVDQGLKPSIEAPKADGFLGKSGAEWGQMAKTGAAGVAGSAIGSLGGPIGSLIGSAVARELSKPGGGLVGGLINGTKTINTSKIPGFAPMTVFSKPQGGLSFPSAPGGGYKGSASFSNRSEGGMRDISPAAARDISKGKAGLY